jgi:hypothetical protein
MPASDSSAGLAVPKSQKQVKVHSMEYIFDEKEKPEPSKLFKLFSNDNLDD